MPAYAMKVGDCAVPWNYRRHFEEAMRVLGRSERDWLASMITGRVALSKWQEAFQSPNDQVKTVTSIATRPRADRAAAPADAWWRQVRSAARVVFPGRWVVVLADDGLSPPHCTGP